jgi:AcrR family transcriptional regulator
LPPDQRREALIAATLPLLRQHGRAVTSRQIAEAAGVAEGTIFRVFESKDDLVAAAIARAFSPGSLLGQLETVDVDAPLRERLVEMVTILQRRLLGIFGLMRAVGMVGPPDHESAEMVSRRQEVNETLVRLVAPDADALCVPPDRALHVLYLLTFAASHHEIADGRILTPTQIVDVVLDGVLKKEA